MTIKDVSLNILVYLWYLEGMEWIFIKKLKAGERCGKGARGYFREGCKMQNFHGKNCEQIILWKFIGMIHNLTCRI